MKSSKPFNTDYYGIHEFIYQKLRENGYEGWGSEDHTQRINRTFEIVLEALKKNSAPHSGKLLDLGCGDGGLSLLLGTVGFEIYGIDISPSAIQWSKYKAKERNIKAYFCVGSVLKLNYPSDYFDVIIDSACSHCIIGNDRKIYFQGIVNALRNDGLYILMCLCGDPTEEQLIKDFDPQTRCLIVT